MFSFPVEVVLKGKDFAVTEQVAVDVPNPARWDDDNVRDVLVEILRAIDRAENPKAAAGRVVMLRGFSWIVEPSGSDVVIAIEIPMGAAVAGPFAANQADLSARISRVLAVERQLTGAPGTVH
jgi:hypothetical protein